MTLAATAPVDNVTNATAAWVVLALLAVFAICATLWQHERVSDRQTARIDTHDEQLAEFAYQMPALLDWLGIEIPAPVEDDSPEAMAGGDADPWGIEQDERDVKRVSFVPAPPDEWPGEYEPDDCPTDEIPVSPATVPDGMPLAVQTALIERPSPVPRDGEWVERTVNIGGTLQTYRIPAKREEAS